MTKLLHHALVRIAGGAALAILSSGTPAAEPLGQDAAALLQRVLQYELILGLEVDPAVSGCLDQQFAGQWLLPADPDIDVSAAASFRLRRAHEACLQPPGNAYMQPRLVSGAVRHTLDTHLQARRELESARQQVHGCLAASRAVPQFEACLARTLAVGPGADVRARWVSIFKRTAGHARGER